MSKLMQLRELLQDRKYLRRVTDLGRQAGRAILEIYDRGHIEVTHKQDNSPLTQADTAAHRIIVSGLEDLKPYIPVLSEESESVSYELRGRWESYWLVDPLDGTREFLEKNGEFTVNIALIHRGIPVFGVVYVPVRDILYTGAQFVDEQVPRVVEDPLNLPPETIHSPFSWAFRQIGAQSPQPIRTRPLPNSGSLTVVASRRHGNQTLDTCLNRLRREFNHLTMTNIGSSLKICLIADGSADFYPRLAPTCEWDTAAAQAVLESAGGAIIDGGMKPLRYNRKDSLLNPDFYAFGDTNYDWAVLLESIGKGVDS